MGNRSNLAENRISQLESVIYKKDMSTSDIIIQDTMINQSDPKVASQSELYNNTNYHDTASHSVQKTKQEEELEGDSSHFYTAMIGVT